MRVRSLLLITLLLLAFAGLAGDSMRQLSASSDETSHLPAGYTYWKTGVQRLNPQHPPLVKLAAALPLLFLEPKLDLEDPGLTQEPPDEWGFGARFLYANDADRLLLFGRLPILLMGLALGLLTYLWARDLFGVQGGLLALTLFALDPNLIAHAQFVTMDVPLGLFFLATLYCAWRASRGLRLGWTVATGAALGAALATKFSAVVLLPVLGLLGFALLASMAGKKRGDPRRLIGASVLILSLAALVLWAVYFFPVDPLFYWHGLEHVNADHNPSYAYYLDGEFRRGGFPHYFAMAFLYKTPLPTLLLIAASILVVRRYRAETWLDEAFLWAPVVAFFLATALYADNLGIRYLLPIYPLLFISAGRLARPLWGWRLGRPLLAAMTAWLAIETLRIHPDELAYFSTVAGGPSHGHEHLDDSNVDWGQTLLRLKAYTDENKIEQIRLLYRWNGDPGYYGIPQSPVSDQEWARRRPPGLYAVSTHLLIRGKLFARESGLATDWLDRYEPVGRIGYSMYLFRFE